MWCVESPPYDTLLNLSLKVAENRMSDSSSVNRCSHFRKAVRDLEIYNAERLMGIQGIKENPSIGEIILI